MKYRHVCSIGFALALSAVVAAPAQAAGIYFNGFETDTTDWNASVTRVPSGSNGITSATGSFHGEAAPGAFNRWGGYNYGAGNAVPTVFQEYFTSVDIFLNVDGNFANDTRFDFDSAINNSSGNFLRDFIFNAGFYDAADVTGPGAGTNRFVISASNNSQPGSAFAKNPARDPIAISDTGWYTFQHHFYDNGGVLAVDLSIFTAGNALVNSWTLSDPTDLIALVGGNRYGWFDYNQFAFLAIDNARLDTADAAAVPEPATMALVGLGLVSMAGGIRRRMRG